MPDDAPSLFADAWVRSERIQGWLTEAQGRVLFEAAQAVPSNGAIVEIGSHHGRSTILLARAKDASVSLTAVDPWDDPRWGGGSDAFDIFRNNLAGAAVLDTVEIRRSLSSEARADWDKPDVLFLYIDGAHDLPTVLSDLDGWTPLLTQGGRFAIHDAFSSVGVTQALLRRQLWNRRFRFEGRVRSLAMYRRVDMSTPAVCLSATRQLLSLSYFVRNLIVKQAIIRHWPRALRVLRHTEQAYPY